MNDDQRKTLVAILFATCLFAIEILLMVLINNYMIIKAHASEVNYHIGASINEQINCDAKYSPRIGGFSSNFNCQDK